MQNVKKTIDENTCSEETVAVVAKALSRDIAVCERETKTIKM